MKFIDLFAGIGGFRFGMESAGHECVAFCEIDKFARASYKAIHNTEGEIELHDITTVTDDEIRNIGHVDAICGGFPCQAFSIAGHRRGFEDTRGTLFFEIARFAAILKPKYLFLENVKGLLNHDGGNTLKVIVNTMNELGYYLNIELLNSKNFGVPQNRERIYILCLKADEITKDGLIQNLNTSKLIIESYLLGLLQKNLVEAKKLQGAKSKEWVLNYLILKDMVGMIQKKCSSKNTLMMIKNALQDYSLTENGQKFTQKQDEWGENTTPIQEKLLTDMDINSLEATENINQSIEELLKKILEENLNTKKLSIILTSINKIMISEIYTSLKIQANILNVIGVLQKYYRSYWTKILLNSTIVQENTKYAKISDYISTKEQGISDWLNGNSTESVIVKKQDIIGHLRGESGRKIFPIGGENEKSSAERLGINILGNTKNPNGTAQGTRDIVHVPNEIKKYGVLQPNFNQSGVVYETDGISPTIRTMQGGGLEPKIRVREATKQGYAEASVGDSVNLAHPNSKTRRGRVGKQIANTLLTGESQGVVEPSFRIRKLTPRECWRLQGFPDWAFDKAQEVNSNSQLYKQAGNSVTVNVIKEIARHL